jgi:CRISPR-associated protein Cmr5
MKDSIQKLIPLARQAAVAVKIPKKDKNEENKPAKVASEYFGYISSLGAGIVQGGLLSAVIFMENSEGDKDKSLVCKAIHWMLIKDQGQDPPANLSLADYILDNNYQQHAAFLQKVTIYATALKIALRTFPKAKKS